MLSTPLNFCIKNFEQIYLYWNMVIIPPKGHKYNWFSMLWMKNDGFDTFPSSLMDLIVTLNVKITEGEGTRARSLAHNTLGVEGHARALGWDSEDWQAIHLLTRTCINQTISWLVCSWSTLVHGQIMGNHGLTRLTTTQTWGKPSPSPL